MVTSIQRYSAWCIVCPYQCSHEGCLKLSVHSDQLLPVLFWFLTILNIIPAISTEFINFNLLTFSARSSIPASLGTHPMAQPNGHTSQDLTLKEESVYFNPTHLQRPLA